METVEEYSWREVVAWCFRALSPRPQTRRRSSSGRPGSGAAARGRDLLVAVDFGLNSKHGFDWALAHIARMADTVRLVHAVSS
jgi:hypothetical protein